MVDFHKLGQEGAVKRRFVDQVRDNLQAPPHSAGDGHVREKTLEGLLAAAMRPVPKDWDTARCEVYGDRLFDAILGSSRSKYWPKVDEVIRHGVATVADMARFDHVAAGQPGMGEVPAWFPDFWERIARTMSRPIEESPLMQAQKLAWVTKFGAWPLDEKHQRRRTTPLMGEEADYPTFRQRTLGQYALTAAEMKWLELADIRYRVKFGAEPVMI